MRKKKHIKSILAVLFFIFMANCLLHGQEFTWQNVSFEGMGFVTGMVIHPDDPEYIVVRTDVGGSYRWISSENRWKPLLDGHNAPGVLATSISKSDPDLLYTVAHGAMFLKSENRGDTWTIVEGFPEISVDANTRHYRWAGNRLAVDPNNNGNVLFYGSESDGTWKSTNQGESWTQVSLEQLPAGDVGGVVFISIDPASGSENENSQTIYAGIQTLGVYRSDNGGESWTLIPGGPDPETFYPVRSALASDGDLYVTYSTQQAHWEDGEGKVFKYNGDTFQDITPTNNNGKGFNGIDVLPADPDRVIAMQWKPGNDNGMHLSNDGGESWTPISYSNRSEPSWYPTYSPWTFTSQIMFDRTNPDMVWKCNGFAVYKTENINATNPLWETEMENLEEFVAGQVMVPPVPGGKAVFSLVMDKIAFCHDSPDQTPDGSIFAGTGDEFGIGTGMDYAVSNPQVTVVVGSQQNNVDQVRQRYTTDNGNTWSSIPVIPDNFNNGNIAISSNDENLWVWAPHNESESVPNLQMHYTTDAGESWQASTGIPSIRNGATHTWAQSIVLASDKVNGDYFYYYLMNDNGSIYRSSDGGVSFEKVYSGLPEYYRCKLKAVPGKEGHLFFHTLEGLLMHSTDYGSTWQEMEGFTQVMGVGFGKTMPGKEESTLYVAGHLNGEEAIYMSTDYGTSWTSISEGKVPVAKVRDISGDLRTAGRVYLAVGGRGVMYGDAGVETSMEGQIIHPGQDKIRLFPNPVDQKFVFVEFPGVSGDGWIAFHDLSGRKVKVVENLPSGIQQIDVEDLENGTYFLTFLQQESVIGNRKMIVLKK